MTTRILPPSEWPRLAGTELETVYPHMDPDQSDVVVVEQDGRIVACWALLRVYHVEGLWVAPEYRKRGRAGWRLLEAMRGLCRRVGARAVCTAACTPEVARLITQLRGVPLPGDQYMLPMEGR